MIQLRGQLIASLANILYTLFLIGTFYYDLANQIMKNIDTIKYDYLYT